MTARGFFRGHPIIWNGDRWLYEDDHSPLPANGGEVRPCAACGECYTLGEGEVDPCLGVLPGVDNACCGHGRREESYIRFSNGVTVTGFRQRVPGMDQQTTRSETPDSETSNDASSYPAPEADS